VEPRGKTREVLSILNPYKETLLTWLRTDSHRPKPDPRTARVMFQHLQAQGYLGGYGRVAALARVWRAECPKRAVFVPLRFQMGEAFQFDWSCEYAVIGGLRRVETGNDSLRFKQSAAAPRTRRTKPNSQKTGEPNPETNDLSTKQ